MERNGVGNGRKKKMESIIVKDELQTTMLAVVGGLIRRQRKRIKRVLRWILSAPFNPSLCSPFSFA